LYLRAESEYKVGNVQNHIPFWEEHVLAEHPKKDELLSYLRGVRYTDLMSSVWEAGSYNGVDWPLGSRADGDMPPQAAFDNYVPLQFEEWVTEHIENKLVVREWDVVVEGGLPHIISPLGIEPEKPRLVPSSS
jgi:hypothetical protein